MEIRTRSLDRRTPTPPFTELREWPLGGDQAERSPDSGERWPWKEWFRKVSTPRQRSTASYGRSSLLLRLNSAPDVFDRTVRVHKPCWSTTCTSSESDEKRTNLIRPWIGATRSREDSESYNSSDDDCALQSVDHTSRTKVVPWLRRLRLTRSAVRREENDSGNAGLSDHDRDCDRRSDRPRSKLRADGITNDGTQTESRKRVKLKLKGRCSDTCWSASDAERLNISGRRKKHSNERKGKARKQRSILRRKMSADNMTVAAVVPKASEDIVEILKKLARQFPYRLTVVKLDRLEFGEASALDPFYNAHIAIVDVSEKETRVPLAYHLGGRDSVGHSNNIVLCRDDLDVTSAMKVLLLILSYTHNCESQKSSYFFCVLN